MQNGNLETVLREMAHPEYLSAYHDWLRDQHDQTVDQLGAGRKLQADLIREYGERLNNVTPDSPEGQMLAAASFCNEALKQLKHRNGESAFRGQGSPQGFAPSDSQKRLFGRLGTVGNGKDGKGLQDFEVTVAEMAVAAALDVREQVGANRENNRNLTARIEELENEVAAAQTGQAAVEAAVADRDAEVAALRDENRELGETITFLQERVEAIDGSVPEPPEKKTILGKVKYPDKDHKTANAGCHLQGNQAGEPLLRLVHRGREDEEGTRRRRLRRGGRTQGRAERAARRRLAHERPRRHRRVAWKVRRRRAHQPD